MSGRLFEARYINIPTTEAYDHGPWKGTPSVSVPNGVVAAGVLSVGCLGPLLASVVIAPTLLNSVLAMTMGKPGAFVVRLCARYCEMWAGSSREVAVGLPAVVSPVV